MAINLFGLEIKKIEKAQELSAPLSAPKNDDGAQDTAPALGSLYYGTYLDTAGTVQSEYNAIQTYRQIAQYAEIDIAIQDIVNEAIPHETTSAQIKLNFDDEAEYSDELKETFAEEFEQVLKLLNYNNLSSDIFRQWYIDGRIAYQVLVDKADLTKGIIELRPIEVLKLRKVREIQKQKTPLGIDSIAAVEEYFLYNEAGFASGGKTGTSVGLNSGNSQSIQTGVKLSTDSVIYVTSGIYDTNGTTVIGNLGKALRPINQLRMMEDAMVVQRIARAPERRIFYIDVGSLPKAKAEQYVKDIMNQYRNKIVYDGATGTITDSKKYMSTLEDFFIPQRESKGTKIETLPGMDNNNIVDTEYFKEKVYQALNIPSSRLQAETGFSLGRSTEVTRDEVKFQKFIDKQRRKFSKLFYDTLKTQLILKGICNNLEWEEIRQNIYFDFQKDNAFSELKDIEILQSKLGLLQQVDQYLGKYFSKEYVNRNILHFNDEEIERMNEQIQEEKGDPTAQPTIPGMPMSGDPSMMSGDPNAQGNPMMQGQQYSANPYAQEDPNAADLANQQ